MHSSKRTIDDMMCISDGCDPHHYIKGRGFDSNGNYIPFEARSESARNRNELSNKITNADAYIYRNELAREALEVVGNNTDDDIEELMEFPIVIEALKENPNFLNENNITNVKDLINKLEQENQLIEQYKDDKIKSFVKQEHKKGLDIDAIADKIGIDKNIIEHIITPKTVAKGEEDPSLLLIKGIDVKKQEAMKAYKDYIDSLGLKTSDSDEQVKEQSKYLKSVLEPEIEIPPEEERLNPVTEFGKNDVFEDRFSGLEGRVKNNTIKEKFTPLSDEKNKYIRVVVSDLFPEMKKEISKGSDAKVFAFNTGYNVVNKEKELIWKGNTNHWVDGLWVIKWTDNDGNEKVEKIAPEYKYYSGTGKYKMNKTFSEKDYQKKLPYDYEALLNEENTVTRPIRLTLMDEFKNAKNLYEESKELYELGDITKEQLKESKNNLRKSTELINDPNKLQEYITRNAKTSKHGINMSLSKTGVFHSNVKEDKNKQETKILQNMLNSIHKIPKINPKTGRIEAVVNRQGIETSWAGYDTSTIFKGAQIALIVGMQKGIIVGENLSKDIREGKFDPSKPLKSSNLSEGSYGEKAKSLAFNPRNFKVLLKEK